MARSVWKGPFVELSLLKKAETAQDAGARAPIKTWSRRIVALAGVGVNTLLALAAHALWRRARGDFARLLLWLSWVSAVFVAAGYFLFSGASGVVALGAAQRG